jgi:large subunit ribosomal protein L24
MYIVRNDEVMVIAGNHKGKTGKVREVLRDKNKVIVEGVNVVTRNMKPSQQNPEGKRVEKEMPIHVSNVALLDPTSKKPTRIKMEITEVNGKRTKKRIAVKSGKEIKKNLV